jgi:hypothetical protein
LNDHYWPFAGLSPDQIQLRGTWTIGTTYRTGIFAWHKSGDLRVVLWQDWKHSEPEFLGDANRVIFGVNAMRDEPPNMAMIYRWSGTEYKILPLVPWSERYQAK